MADGKKLANKFNFKRLSFNVSAGRTCVHHYLQLTLPLWKDRKIATALFALGEIKEATALVMASDEQNRKGLFFLHPE
ncbi:MAG: hypothetical protein Q9M33_08070 [Robiginitomaculum sp.]|nr:hypothetical protein [Robiginitomaculum sp.]